MSTLTASHKTWYIAHTNGDVGYWGILEPNQTVETGQTNLESFDNEEAWNTRKAELGIETDQTDLENPGGFPQ